MRHEESPHTPREGNPALILGREAVFRLIRSSASGQTQSWQGPLVTLIGR